MAQNIQSSEEVEVREQREVVVKKVKELFNMLKSGEDEAQVQMLNWENFVI